MRGFVVEFWHWWAAAALLLSLEIAAPGVAFMFMAVGAFAAGLLLLAAPGAAIEWQLLAFGVVGLAAAVALRPLVRQWAERRAGRADPLNDPAAALVGTVATLDAPIVGGRGRLKIGDGSWPIVGPDMAAGFAVRVVEVDRGALRVEPAT